MSVIYDRDPGDEHISSGICSNPWCENAATPDDELCAACIEDFDEETGEPVIVTGGTTLACALGRHDWCEMCECGCHE